MGGTYGNKDHGRMLLNPGLIPLADEAEGAHGTGDEQLDGEDSIDLADELMADVNGGLCDALAILEVIWQVGIVLAPTRAGTTAKKPGLIVLGAGWLVRRRSLAVLRRGTGASGSDAVWVVLRSGGVLCVGHGGWFSLSGSMMMMMMRLMDGNVGKDGCVDDFVSLLVVKVGKKEKEKERMLGWARSKRGE